MRANLFLAAAIMTAAAPLSAQTQTVDYRRADLIRTAGTYFLGMNVRPTWLEDSVRFWYRSSSRQDEGVYYLVEPARAARQVLFDNARLAAALSVEADTLLEPSRLPRFSVIDTGRTIEIELRKKVFRCDRARYTCQTVDSLDWATTNTLKRGPTWASRSPDKRWDVFQYRYNMYVRPAAVSDSEAIAKRDSLRRARAQDSTAKKDTTGRGPRSRQDSVPLPRSSVALTADGTRLFAYGGAPREIAADTIKPKPERVSVSWAPDSRRFTVSRDDQRNLRVYPMYSSTKDQPIDQSYYYATPGDSVVPTFDVHVIDVIERTNVRAQNPPTPVATANASTSWGRGSDRFFVVNANRGPNRMSLMAVDARTGASTTVARDSSATWVELSHSWGQYNWRSVNGGDDLIWWSQRDGWAHLYRFAADGTLKNQLETGPYAVDAIQYVDSLKKQVYFTAWGREGTFPYYGRLHRVNFDGTGLTVLTPEEGSHTITFVPKGGYFIDAHSRVDMLPVITLRSALDGRVLLELGRGDVDYLRSLGWRPPELIQVKARDGVTDLWGLMYKPSHFDSTKTYPVLDHIYPGPQVGSVRTWGYASGGSEEQALAELGFIVVQIDHLGTPRRSKWFHDFYFANMGDNGIADHVVGIRQLAARYRWMDINRVGIYGHSGGGLASTGAILRFPDFYKVAVSGAGNHDPRTYAWYWAGRYQGKFDKDGYAAAANQTYAKNLKGKLLIMHGDLDNNVHPANTLGVVNALIKANKNFDMLIFPDAGHGLPDYAIRRRWDYFVKHLLGAEPPADYQMMAAPGGGFRF